MYLCSLPDEALTDPNRREVINLVLLECKTTKLWVPLGHVFLQSYRGLEKPQSYQEKVRSEIKKTSNKDKSNTSLFYKYFFLSKDKTLIETYEKYSSEKNEAKENYKGSAALISLKPCRIALCSVLSVNPPRFPQCNHSNSLLLRKHFC